MRRGNAYKILAYNMDEIEKRIQFIIDQWLQVMGRI